MSEKTATKAIHVNAETHAHVAAYAKKQELSISEAAERLIETAVGRLAALARYAKKGPTTERLRPWPRESRKPRTVTTAAKKRKAKK